MMYQKIYSKCFIIFIALVLLMLQPTTIVLALSDEQKKLYNQNILYYDIETCAAADGGGAAILSGSGNAEKIWNFLISQGFTPEQTAGFLGNFSVETGGSFEPGTEQVGAGNAYGIAQWDDRRSTLEAYARQKGQKVNSLELQLDFLMHELKGSESAAYRSIKAAKSVEEAWKAVSYDFERPAEPGNPERGKEAQKYYSQFSGNSGSTSTGGGSSAASCAGSGTGTSGEVVDGISWPVPKKWWDDHPDYFTGPHHDYAAVDISVPSGTEVYSMIDGQVVAVESSGSCGVGIFINGSGGIQLGYCHGTPGSVKVSAGDAVKSGQQIMRSDNTGHSTGPHLHIQIKLNGTLVCPQDIFKNLGAGKGTDFKSLPTRGCSS